MNNFIVVFSAIKENCNEAGITNEKCFSTLRNLVIGRQLFLPLYLYLEVLQDLGLIEFGMPGKGIMLTEKGKHTDSHYISGFRILISSAFYLTRYLLLLILFWPLLLLFPKQTGGAHNKNSTG